MKGRAVKTKKTIAVLAMVLGSVVATAPGAMARSDAWAHPDGVGRMSCGDGGDVYAVCDTKSDYIGVAGRLDVRQADGSWGHFTRVRDGNGNNSDCTSNNVDVIRESADCTFTICRQNTADGARYNRVTSPAIPGD